MTEERRALSGQHGGADGTFLSRPTLSTLVIPTSYPGKAVNYLHSYKALPLPHG